MFSHSEQCLYRNNQLAEVICQLRFPEILIIDVNPPAEFQEEIRADFPRYAARKDTPAPRITGTPGHFSLANQPEFFNYQFVSDEGFWRINLTSKFISLSCSRYTSWEVFSGKLDKLLVAFIKVYKPAYFERIGLRYLNFISRSNLNLEGIPFSELISPTYLVPLADEEVSEPSASRCSVDAEMALRGGCRVKLHAGPGMIKRGNQPDQEVKFIFDQDLYMPGKVPVNLSAAALQTLHSQAFCIFRGAITEKLHDAMHPEF